MASKNPLRGAFIASNEQPQAEPHSRGLRHPAHLTKVAFRGRPPVEMPRGHGARATAKGRDLPVSSNKAPKLPGMKEGGRNLLQRVSNGATVVGPNTTSSPNVRSGSPNSKRRVGVPGNRSMGGHGKPGGPSRSDKAAGPIRSGR